MPTGDQGVDLFLASRRAFCKEVPGDISVIFWKALFRILRELAAERNCEITDINGDMDHIHFLLRYPPTIILSDMIGALKSKSSASVLDKFGELYHGKHARTFWSSGFFLCSVGGATLEILKSYIEIHGRA